MTDSIARVSAADCGPSTKIMRIEKYAFVPDVQYMCCSQPVVVYNVSGRYMSFSYKVLYGRMTSEVEPAVRIIHLALFTYVDLQPALLLQPQVHIPDGRRSQIGHGPR